MSTIKIAGCKIGNDCPPFIIAEMSGNHNQSLERALEIVRAAAKNGAHAIKIQTYTADTMTLDIDQAEFIVSDDNSLWKGKTLHSLYQEAHTPWEWHQAIFSEARKHGIIPFSAPFDSSAVDFLESLGTPCYKIASFENTDIPLIQKVAETGKPLIISTGMASVAELHDTVKVAREAGCKDLILLKCTSTYPAAADNTNLLTIPHMKNLFQCEVGLSDHTLGIGVSIASVAVGASIIEKHFTLDRADGGVDSKFSVEPTEMESLVTETYRAWEALGEIKYGPTAAEIKSIKFRRSLYIVSKIKKGETITSANLRAIRPGLGLAPKHYNSLLGKKATRDINTGTPASWELFS